MKYIAPTLALGLVIAATTGTAVAQTGVTGASPTATVVAPGDRPYTPNNPPPQPPHKTDWGWLGLIGLAGLAGLIPKKQTTTTVRTTGAPGKL